VSVLQLQKLLVRRTTDPLSTYAAIGLPQLYLWTFTYDLYLHLPASYGLDINATHQAQTSVGNLIQLNAFTQNKAIIDRRFRSLCCRLGSHFKRPKSSPVRPLAYNWYYCAQFAANPKAACTLRFSWAATWNSKYDAI